MLEPRQIKDFEENAEDGCITGISLDSCEKLSKKNGTFCQDCENSFCLECKIMHDDHQLQDIVDRLNKREIDIRRKIETCQLMKKELSDQVKTVYLCRVGLETLIPERKKKLQSFIEEMMDENLKYFLSYENETINGFQQQVDILENHTKELKNSLDIHKELKTIKDAATYLKQDNCLHRNVPSSLEKTNVPIFDYPDDEKCKIALKVLCGTFNYSPRSVINLPYVKMREFIHLENISSAYHLCVRRCGTHFLVGDNLGNILNIDAQEKNQTMVKTIPSKHGYFTSTVSGDTIFYIDFSTGNVIKVFGDAKRRVFLSEKKYWQLRCLTLSKTGKEIIIGMASSKEECKLVRQTLDGKKTFDIRLQRSSDLPVSKLINLCENVNGDLCISLMKSAVISVQRNGTIRFSYSGHDPTSNFFPGGMCTDNNGRIIICNSTKQSSSIHLLDENGTFLGVLLRKEQCMAIPLSVFIDKSDKTLMFVGWYEQKFLTCYELE